MRKSPAETLASSKTVSRRIPQGIERKKVWHCLLREKRTALRLTLRDVAEAVGISVTALQAIDTGGELCLTNAKKIAAFFCVTIDEMWPKRLDET